MEDWEKLANGLDIGRATINNIKEKCIHSTTVAECQRRELVVAYCDKLSSGNPHRVALDIVQILDNKMGQKRQAWILRQQFPTVCGKLCNLYVYKITGISGPLWLEDCLLCPLHLSPQTSAVSESQCTCNTDNT